MPWRRLGGVLAAVLAYIIVGVLVVGHWQHGVRPFIPADFARGADIAVFIASWPAMVMSSGFYLALHYLVQFTRSL